MSNAGPHGFNPARTTTDLRFTLLDKVENKDGAWVYVQASGAIAQYGLVTIDDDGQAAEGTTTTAGSTPKPVGWAQTAFADDEYGWIWVGKGGGSGKGIKGKVAASYAADAKLYTTATAGVCDDAATTLIAGGVRGLTTDGGSGSSVELYAAGICYVN